MPRKPEGARPLTGAQRQARFKQQQAKRNHAITEALNRIIAARTIAEARRIAASVINGE